MSATALAVVGAVSTPATAADSPAAVSATRVPAAEELPTSRCEILDTSELPHAFGHTCSAHDGAPEQGEISGTFVIENYRGMAVHCLPEGGYAELPDHVEGVYCIEA